jgi:hypothetical protein
LTREEVGAATAATEVATAEDERRRVAEVA